MARFCFIPKPGVSMNEVIRRVVKMLAQKVPDDYQLQDGEIFIKET